MVIMHGLQGGLFCPQTAGHLLWSTSGILTICCLFLSFTGHRSSGGWKTFLLDPRGSRLKSVLVPRHGGCLFLLYALCSAFCGQSANRLLQTISMILYIWLGSCGLVKIKHDKTLFALCSCFCRKSLSDSVKYNV